MDLCRTWLLLPHLEGWPIRSFNIYTMKNTTHPPKITLVLLWITVLLNMIFADIFSIIVELVDGNALEIPLDVTTMMALAALLTNIPILMVVLSWVLPYAANRWANGVAAIFTMLYVVGGGTSLPHYWIIGSIEVLLLLLILVVVFRWQPHPETV